MDEAENQIDDVEHKEAENQQSEQDEGKRTQKDEDSVSSLWDNFKRSNIPITGEPEGDEKEQESVHLFEKIMKENFPNLVKEIDVQVQEAQRVPTTMDAKRPTPRHVTTKLPTIQDEEGILKAAREKQVVTHKGVPIRLSADFSTETCRLHGTGKKCSVMRSRGLQPGLLYRQRWRLEWKGS